jgi:hypothetical protein
MKALRSVRHYEFTGALKQEVQLVGKGRLQVALRLGGELWLGNIVLLRSGKAPEVWRVGPNGGQIRGDSRKTHTAAGDLRPIGFECVTHRKKITPT